MKTIAAQKLQENQKVLKEKLENSKKQRKSILIDKEAEVAKIMENTHQVQSKLALARSAKKEAEKKMEENIAKNAQIVVDLKTKLFESEQHYKNQTKLNAEVKEEQRQMIQ